MFCGCTVHVETVPRQGRSALGHRLRCAGAATVENLRARIFYFRSASQSGGGRAGTFLHFWKQVLVVCLLYEETLNGRSARVPINALHRRQV